MKKGLPRVVLIGVSLCAVAIGVWAIVPPVAALLLQEWLHRAGFKDVSIQVGYPGSSSVAIPEIRLKQPLQNEQLVIESKGVEVKYSLVGLLTGRLDQVQLPDVTVALVAAVPPDLPSASTEVGRGPGQSFSPLNTVTVSDLVQGLPMLPFDELRLGRLRVLREQATGPLREVMVAGTVRQQGEGLLAELTFQGNETQAYVLRLSELATRITSIQLGTRSPSSTPILSWRSEAVAGEVQSELRGMFDVNVQELAPFLALILPMGSEWEQVTGRIQAKWAGTASSTVALASVWRDPGTRVLGTLQVGVKFPELKGIGKKLAIALSAKFSGNPAQLQWSIDPGTIVAMDIESSRMALLESFRAFLPAGTQSFRIESAQGVSGELRWSGSPPLLTAEGPVTLSYDSSTDPVHAELILAHLAFRGRLIETGEGRFEIVGSLPSAIIERLPLQRVTGNIEGRLSLNDREIRGALLPSSALAVTRFQHGVISVARGMMELSEALPFRFIMATDEWKAGPSTVALRVPEIRLAGLEILLRQATVRMEEGGGSLRSWKGRGTATIQGLTVGRSAGRSIPADLSVRLAADPAMVTADIQSNTQDRLVTLDAQAEHSLATGRGRFHGTVGPVSFDRTEVRLRRLWSPWSFPVELTGGKAAVTVDLGWEAGASDAIAIRSGTGEIVMDNLSGHYREFAFAGLQTNLQVTTRSLDRISTSRPAEIKLASLSRGVEATHVSLTAQAEWNVQDSLPIVEVRDLRGQLLGGIMTSQGVRADLSRPPYSFTVLARALDLAKILSLEQQKGLQGIGLLDGTIPVTVAPRGVTVKDGYFEARPPGGVIQYHASAEAIKAVTGANANMQLVLQALNNFHYNVLQVEAQYVEDGTLNLKARLEGRNPDMKKAPPVHFNLTVQENVPALLKTLRLVQDIEESVQNRLVRP